MLSNFSKILEYSLLLILTLFFIAFIYISFNHIIYPYELEWIEGGYLVQCSRITEGKPIYISPDNADFIPYVYTPLYFYIIGYLGKIFGISFALGRIVSFLSTLGIGILIFLIIKKETENLKASFIGFAIFFSAYSFTGYWYDIVRSDTLFVFLLMLGCFLMRFKNDSLAMLILCSLTLVLAFFTKQPAYYFIGLCSLMFLFTNFWKIIVLYAFSLIFAIGGILCANYLSSGLFWFYIFKLCVGADFNLYLLHDILKNYIFKGFSFMMLILLIFLFKNFNLLLKSKKSQKVIWLLGLAAGFLSFLSTMIFGGGYANGLIPIVCFSSISLGIAYHYLSKSLITKTITVAILILQLTAFSYDPRNQIPTKLDYELGGRFIDYISKIPSDEVLVFKHSYYPVMCGKKPQIHFGSFHDIFLTKEKINLEPFFDKFRNRDFGAIILDYKFSEENPKGLDRLILDNYYFKEQIFTDDEDGFYTKSGPAIRPNYVFLPRVESIGLFENYDSSTEYELPKNVDPAAVIRPPGK